MYVIIYQSCRATQFAPIIFDREAIEVCIRVKDTVTSQK